MYQHNPTLTVTSIANSLLNTAGTVTTMTSTVAVPANTFLACTLQMAVNGASSGNCTVTATAGGFGSRFFSNFQSNGAQAATHTIVGFVAPEEIPAGTVFTYTRGTGGNWPLGEGRVIALGGVTRLGNLKSTSLNAPPGSIDSLDNTFDGGTVVIPGFVKSNITITLCTSSLQKALAGLGDGGTPGYSSTGRPAFTIVSITGGNTLTSSVAHGLSAGEIVMVTASANGLLANVRYYVLPQGLTTTEFRLSTSVLGSEVSGLTNGTGLTIVLVKGADMVTVQGNGTNFTYCVASTIYPLVAPETIQRFTAQQGATAGNQPWIWTQYRYIPG